MHSELRGKDHKIDENTKTDKKMWQNERNIPKKTGKQMKQQKQKKTNLTSRPAEVVVYL